MKTLYLPDCHQRHEIHQSIIDHEKPDRIVHLGDYWDNWDDCPLDALDAARWVKERLKAGDVCLLGNHDIWYLYGNQNSRCSGNTLDKFTAIRSVLMQPEREQFRLFDWW